MTPSYIEIEQHVPIFNIKVEANYLRGQTGLTGREERQEEGTG